MDKLITMMLLALTSLSSCVRERELKDGDLILDTLNIDVKLKIDSAFIYSFCNNSIDCDTIKKEIKTFYKRRDYNIAWFNKIGISYPIKIFHNQLKNYQYNFSNSSFYNSRLNNIIEGVQNNESGILYNKNNIQKIDLLLTTLFFRYSKIAYGGKVENLTMLEWFIPKHSKDYQTTLDSFILITNKAQEKIPLNKNYFLLKKELKKYRDIEKWENFQE